MHLSEIMASNPVTVSSDTVLGEAVRLMDEHRIHHLPVVRDDKLVGVLSDRDLLLSLGKRPSSVKRVSDVMSPGPVTGSLDASLAEAARILARWRIGCLPITSNDSLLGLITEVDLLDAFVGSDLYGRLEADKNPPVQECMRIDPVTVAADTACEIAMELIHQGDFRHLPIVDNAVRPVGIVSDRDLRRALGQGLEGRTHVSEVGTSPPSTTLRGESLARASDRMVHERISAQLVVDEDDMLLGILTITDVLEHLAQHFE